MRCRCHYKGALPFLAGGIVGFSLHALWREAKRSYIAHAVKRGIARADDGGGHLAYSGGIDPSEFPAPAGK